MSETPSTRRFFIPPWLDELDLKPHPFRVLCHLLRRAGEDGRCYPSGPSIATACRISKDSVWPALNALEAIGVITRQPKKFGTSNSYLITPPIGGNDGVIESPSIGGNSGSIEPLPIEGKGGSVGNPQSAEMEGLQSAENLGCQSAEMEGCKEILLKKSNLKKAIRELSLEGVQFAQWFKSSLPSSINLKADWQRSFAIAHDDMVRIDKRTSEQIREVSKWGRQDDFWKNNFMSPAKLRQRDKNGIQWFDVFSERMKSGSIPKKTVNTGGRHAGITSMEITGDEF